MLCQVDFFKKKKKKKLLVKVLIVLSLKINNVINNTMMETLNSINVLKK